MVSGGCIVPAEVGCLHGRAVAEGLDEAPVLLRCQNQLYGRCTRQASLYAHADCFEAWEDFLVERLRKLEAGKGRGTGTWSDAERLRCLWNKRGIKRGIFDVNRCDCGGNLTKAGARPDSEHPLWHRQSTADTNAPPNRVAANVTARQYRPDLYPNMARAETENVSEPMQLVTVAKTSPPAKKEAVKEPKKPKKKKKSHARRPYTASRYDFHWLDDGPRNYF